MVVVHLRLRLVVVVVVVDVPLYSTVMLTLVIVVVVVVSHVKGPTVKIRQEEHQRVIHLGIRHQRARTTKPPGEITLGQIGKIGMCTTISQVWLPRTRRMLLATVRVQTTEARRVG